MSGPSARELDDRRILAERAAEWVYTLKEGSDAERAEFADWLAESPRHVEEFLVTTAFDRELDRLNLRDIPAIRAHLERGSPSVVPLRTLPTDKYAEYRKQGARKSTRWAIGVAASILVLVTATWLWQKGGEVYSTGIGEQRTVLLPDGSQLLLTADSKTRVRYSRQGRRIELVRGEALFKVARDKQRPFVVESGESIIRALGTQFNVLRRPSGTTVAVLEGAIAVKSDDVKEATLRAGEEVKISVDGRLEKRKFLAEVAVTALQQQRLVFHADTLADIAAEFNRYNRAPRLLIQGNAASMPRYTGVFDADDPSSLLAFLRDDPQLTLEARGDKLVIRLRAEPRN